MQTLDRLRATCILMFAALCLSACASGPPEDGPRGDWGRAPREPGGDEGLRPMMRQLFISPAGEPFRADPGAPYPVAVWFAGADKDHDGALTRDEFVADALRFFDVLDADHNGVIDGFEVSTYETRIAPEILMAFAGAGRPGGGAGGGPPPGGPDGDDAPPRSDGGKRAAALVMGGMLQGAAPYSLLAEPQPVSASDGDFDRRITRAEATKAAKTRFALLDKDGDGVLHLADLPRTPAQQMFDGPPPKGGRPQGGPGGRRGGPPPR